MEKTIEDICKNIALFLMDVDGVLTDGGIIYTDAGEQIKQFHSRDGIGLRLLMDAGIAAGVVTGRQSRTLLHRCEDLGITLVHSGVSNKGKAIEQIAQTTGIAPEHMAFMGDDLIDLPAMTRVGLAVCVPEAAEEVKAHAHITTKCSGGRGAVREVCEILLKAQGKWDAALAKYLS